MMMVFVCVAQAIIEKGAKRAAGWRCSDKFRIIHPRQLILLKSKGIS
jgi:hypothetical protein